MRKNHIKTNCKKYNSSNNTENLVLFGMLGTTLLSGVLLALPSALADDSTVTDVNITVPVACAVTSTVGTVHTATIDNGTYEDDIGTTTIKTTCNDSQGFSIYAIGYTNEEYGNTTLKPSVLDATQNSIITGTATSGATSNWAMKLTAVSSTYTPTILSDTDGVYSNYHKVPTAYTKVATMDSSTNTTTGASIEATYAAYIAGDQPADTYNGKVKYTMVYPASAPEPFLPHEETTASGQICYYPNFDATAENGTMGCQTISDYAKDWSQCVEGTDYSSYCYDGDENEIISSLPSTNNAPITLLASNFSRTGYGFAGWSDKFDYATNTNARFYGPQETITIPDTSIYTGEGKGLSLYAVWIKSAGSLQDQSKVAQLCGANGTGGSLATAPTNDTANLASVSALTDQRDHQTYAIAKLADGKCWMIENLRLESRDTVDNNRFDSSIANASLAQGYGTSATYGNFGGLANAESANVTYSTAANSLYYSGTQSGTASINIGTSYYPGDRMPRYNNLNTQSRAQNSPNTNTFNYNNTDGGMYSYGNYYTWHAAIADTTFYSGGDHDTTSICPTGWKLPLGNKSTGDIEQGAGDSANRVGGFSYLDRKMGGTGAYQSTAADSLRWRKFPLNFLYSGDFYTSSASSRGRYGYYWSSTANDNNPSYSYSYVLALYSSSVTPDTGAISKYYGLSIRCVSGS